MLHFLFNCKPHQILMHLLLCLRDYPFSIFFNIYAILYYIYSNLLLFFYFLFVELLNPLCLVLDTDPLQCNSGKKKPRNMCMIIALFHLFHTMWWNGIKWVLSSGGISRHSVLYLLQDNNNGRQSCVHANFEPDELQKTIDLHTCHAYLD